MRNPFKRFWALPLLMFFLLCGQESFSQGKPSFKWGRFNFLGVDTIWKYKEGPAKPEYFDPGFDDLQWQTVNNQFLDNLPRNTGTWPFTGVFRKKFTVPDSLRGRRAEFFLMQFGASEIYMDGKLVCRFGKVTGDTKDVIVVEKAVQFQLDNQPSHLLAVYHSSHIKPSLIAKHDLINLSIMLSPLNADFSYEPTPYPHALLSMFIILAICLFFCCVYGFYPYRLASLTSALYLASFSLIFISGVIVELNADVGNFNLGGNLWRIGFTCHTGWNLLFMYSIYYNRMPKRSLIIILLMAIGALFVVNYDELFPFRIIVPFIILFQIETWRITILGIRKKKTGFWILAIGLLISELGSLIAIFDLFNFFPWYLTNANVVAAVITDLSFPFTLLLQFALEFGSANRDLRQQLVTVKDLSRKNLEQEQEKQQMLSTQNETLEKQVAERTSQVVSQKEEIEKQRDKVTNTLEELRAAQNQLIQSEKMASLGELTAGIAHEIQNPLNFVNNFSEVSNELIAEMNVELDKGDIGEAKAIAADIKQNLEKINHHGKRADSIVKGMLQHSHSNSGQKEPFDINTLADEYLRLSYHGLRAKDKSFNATLQTDFDESIGKINIIPQEIGRVLLNLYNNAFYALAEKTKINPDFNPQLAVASHRKNGWVEVTVKDNGNGIPANVVDKIFQPFFTTKPTGQGTGLGLSLSYDIIKAHGGEIKVKSALGEGAEFIIHLPL